MAKKAEQKLARKRILRRHNPKGLRHRRKLTKAKWKCKDGVARW